jgi:ribosomal protein S10
VATGRICVAALNDRNVDTVCEAIAKTLRRDGVDAAGLTLRR